MSWLMDITAPCPVHAPADADGWVPHAGMRPPLADHKLVDCRWEDGSETYADPVGEWPWGWWAWWGHRRDWIRAWRLNSVKAPSKDGCRHLLIDSELAFSRGDFR